VTYLLDVNVLLAMRYVHHVHHDRTICWLRNLETGGASARFASCSITELGFVRIAGNRNSGLAANVGALLIPEHPYGPMMVREPTIPYGVATRHSSHLN
jgi:predicted nucleic acid-binding protein